ncbi:MAG: sigma-E processing peptidase SpoIIGA [Oscillospiraceae bacterium]|nr:sigma-E processing peptidase SpoIIGA [Oscillospiraceae bacterium]
MGTVYIDLLIIINLYITFFLLKSTTAFLHLKITNPRIIAGSVAGGVSSLLILLPPLPFLLGSAVKIVLGMLIVLIAFGYRSGYEYLKHSLIFIIINVVFAGFTLLLWFFAAPLGMEYNNGIVYFDISFTALIVTTMLAYGLVRLLRYILDVKLAGGRTYEITVSKGGNSVSINALADTGNMLTDYFSGLPVVICPALQVSVLRFEELGRARLLPYNTIDSSGLIPVFKADEIVIKSDNMRKSVNALIGIINADNPVNDSPAIFNPKLLI